jgi:hypothetical protein
MPTVATPDILLRANDMTTRARWYLAIAGIRHILVGAFALTMASSFKSTSFIPIIEAAPLWFWAAFSLGAGIACAGAAATKSEPLARLGMAWSAVLTLLIGTGLLISVFTGQSSSPTGPIIWLAVALKDFVVCAQPIRSPFEGLTERLAQKQTAT